MLVYLDNSATTKQYELVTEKMVECMRGDYGNPSSLHNMGLSAEKLIREARSHVAEATGRASEEIYFTSGGTEAANLALFGAADSKKRRGKKIITTCVEHAAVIESCKKLASNGFEVVYISVDDKCRLNLDELYSHIDDKTILISVMQVNNEVGTIMPIGEIAGAKGKGLSGATSRGDESGAKGGLTSLGDESRAKGDWVLHTDAVQAFGKMPFCGRDADIVTVSAHKIHGPKGCGAIFIRKGVQVSPMIFGGGQEKNMRSGTENVAGISGFGEAVRIMNEDFAGRVAYIANLRKYLLDGIKAEINNIKINSIEEISLTGEAGLGSPAILNISFLGTRGEVILHGLESEKIYVSTGAACSSNKKGKNSTLTAMGLSDKEIEGSLRFSFSEFNTIEEMDFVLLKLKEQVNRFRKLGSFR